MKKLNTKQPYGKVCGAGKARFEQDGCLFDIHGNELLTDDQLAAQKAAEAEEAARLKLEQDEAEKANKGKGRGKKADVDQDPAVSDVDDQLAAQQDLND